MAVVAIGNFDGVHFGHRLVLTKAIDLSKKDGGKSIALTFSPHPRNFFSENKPIKTIIDDDYKKQLILSLGIDEVYFQNFNKEFADLDCEGFIKYLKENFLCKTIVCGSNFRFGKSAAYNVSDLSTQAKKSDISVCVVPVDERFSSSKIRCHIKNGQLHEASELLGYPFSICAPVVYGLKLGSRLGFPTVNQKLPNGLIEPKHGVYAGFVKIDENFYESLTNIGFRPTVNEDENDIRIETFILGFNGDLYGRVIRIYITDFIRGEKKFTDYDELQNQIKKDCEFVSGNSFFGRKYMQNKQ